MFFTIKVIYQKMKHVKKIKISNLERYIYIKIILNNNKIIGEKKLSKN